MYCEDQDSLENKQKKIRDFETEALWLNFEKLLRFVDIIQKFFSGLKCVSYMKRV